MPYFQRDKKSTQEPGQTHHKFIHPNNTMHYFNLLCNKLIRICAMALLRSNPNVKEKVDF